MGFIRYLTSGSHKVSWDLSPMKKGRISYFSTWDQPRDLTFSKHTASHFFSSMTILIFVAQ